jgi:nucleotide-binding universal stress UspA family protein
MAAPVFLPKIAQQFKNVLFATDFSPGSLHALPYVAGMAKTFGSTVHLCHIIAPTPLAAGAAAPRLYEATGQDVTEHLATLLHAPLLEGLNGKLVLAEGAIEEELLKVVRQRNIDLVVAGTHGRTGWRKLLLGSVAEAMRRVTTCPILTVGPAQTFRDGVLFKRILFPTDLSRESKSILPYLTLLAEKYGSRVTVLHVLPKEAGINRDAKALGEPVRKNMIQAFQSDLAPSGPEFIVESGDIVDTVLRVAQEKNADLIAMGIRNAFVPGTHLRSSKAYGIIAGAHCPVLTSR